MLLKGCVDRDPLQMLYELLDSHAVVKNADPAKNFEDKYILRFYKRIIISFMNGMSLVSFQGNYQFSKDFLATKISGLLLI